MVRLFGYFCCALFLLITSLSCDSSEPPPIVPTPDIIKDTITVSIESFTHRSVTLRVQSTVHSLQSSIKVLRSFNSTETIIAEFPLEVADTTITDDDNGVGLLLDTTYTYFAVRVDSLGEWKDTSNTVIQKTLAPTSHDYTWQEYTFGDPGYPNTLYDVWGTDENNVWACGGIKINDTVYGIVKWDGTEWKPISQAGGVAIFGFSENDIWTVGGAIFHFDGTQWNDITYPDPIFYNNQPYTSLWGTSSSNLYLGNAWGKIIHWDGVKAEDMGIDAFAQIVDIWGFGDHEIYAVAGAGLVGGGQLFQFDGLSWKLIADINNNIGQIDFKGNFLTIWGYEKNELFLMGSYLYKKLRDVWVEIGPFGGIYLKLRGNQSNNIFCVGFGGLCKHFNGVEWKDISNFENIENALRGIFMINNQVFIVGENFYQAIIIQGVTTN
ncbi:MAG: hypothetical protein IPJ03_19515 [Ignavibacteriales bacterium]|nr:hypothetical protein [Ignavibacteriales bacterium]